MSKFWQSVLLATAGSFAASAHAVTINFSVDHLNQLGGDLLVAIDFIDGGAPSNSVDLFNFVTDGSLDVHLLEGGASVSGSGFSLTDGSFLNSVLLNLSSASFLNFSWSSDIQPSLGADFADQLAIYLLNPADYYPAQLTSDPLSAHALLTWSLFGSELGELNVYSAIDGSGVQWQASIVSDAVSVPEPSSLAMLVLGAVALGSRKYLRGEVRV